MPDTPAPIIPPAAPPPHPPVPDMPWPPAGEHGLSPQALELLRFVREESRADRQYFTRLGRYFVGLIAAILVVLGLVGYKSMQDFKDQLRNQAETQIQKATTDEIAKMQGDIQSRLNKEFSDPNIKETIHKAAGEAVKPAVEAQVGATFSLLQTEANSTHADVEKYVVPRALTAQQKEDLKTYLAKHKMTVPNEPVSIRYVANDPEAEAYAAQLDEAFKAGGWDVRVVAPDPIARNLPPDFPGIAVSYEGEEGPDTFENQAANIWSLAFVTAHIVVAPFIAYHPLIPQERPNFSGPFIYVGPRPLELPTKHP